MEKSRPLIVFIGNSIFRDDRIGLIVGEKLRDNLMRDGCDVEIVEKTGLNLIDYLEAREKVVIVDSIMTSRHRIGEVLEIDIKGIESETVWSPHYIGVLETIKLMEMLSLDPPKKLMIIGIEVSDIYTISNEISKELEEKLDTITMEVYYKIGRFLRED
ncbi:MAG: hydrogenase maturation protease [Aigarchaeota archaeon]|nr:hydrogenase maturation protease [Aigarchaeota archaeon]MCX8192598.1 hydrogenase maturation protease [Nitrososphaeria archaeon]MDW7985666.1 hydrogenase maturation protease [Nitrososphaerota archaeon]